MKAEEAMKAVDEAPGAEIRIVEDKYLLFSARWSTRTAMLFGSGLGLALAVSLAGAIAYHIRLGMAGTILWLSLTTVGCTIMGFLTLWFAGHFISQGISHDISSRRQPYLFIGKSIMALILFVVFTGITLFGLPLLATLVVTIIRNRRHGIDAARSFFDFFASILLVGTSTQKA